VRTAHQLSQLALAGKPVDQCLAGSRWVPRLCWQCLLGTILGLWANWASVGTTGAPLSRQHRLTTMVPSQGAFSGQHKQATRSKRATPAGKLCRMEASSFARTAAAFLGLQSCSAVKAPHMLLHVTRADAQPCLQPSDRLPAPPPAALTGLAASSTEGLQPLTERLSHSLRGSATH
jgi:hypothetical protein